MNTCPHCGKELPEQRGEFRRAMERRQRILRELRALNQSSAPVAGHSEFGKTEGNPAAGVNREVVSSEGNGTTRQTGGLQPIKWPKLPRFFVRRRVHK